MVGLNAERPNIKYIIKQSTPTEEFSTLFTDELISTRTMTPKTINFCQTLADCITIYDSIKKRLGEDITEPPGLPHIPELTLVTLFTAASKNGSWETTLQEVCKPNSVLRVVIASSAFGMEVKCSRHCPYHQLGTPSYT